MKVKNVTIVDRSGWLYLVATLPPKPGSGKENKHQQRIATGLASDPMGWEKAKDRALVLAIQLEDGTFTWPDKTSPAGICKLTFKDAIARFKEQYFIDHLPTIQSLGTWEHDYLSVLSHFDGDKIVTAKVLQEFIKTKTKPNTSTRKKACVVLGGLARFLQLDLNVASLRGNYSASKVNPRLLPDDKTIVEWYDRIKYPSSKWAYGMLATFGLRNHELFFVDLGYLVENRICYVTEGKRGARKTWPFYPDWLDEFNLTDCCLPQCTGKYYRDYGDRVTKIFQRNHIPFPPYALRHCWARRTIDLGLDIRLASKQMGHSEKVHADTYNLWIDDDTHQKAFEKILAKVDRM
jgi:integrase